MMVPVLRMSGCGGLSRVRNVAGKPAECAFNGGHYVSDLQFAGRETKHQGVNNVCKDRCEIFSKVAIHIFQEFAADRDNSGVSLY